MGMGEGRTGCGFVRSHSSKDTTPGRVREEARPFPSSGTRSQLRQDPVRLPVNTGFRIYKEWKSRISVRNSLNNGFKIQDISIIKM